MVEAGKKQTNKQNKTSATAEGSWGIAHSITLLCKGSLLHNRNAEFLWFSHEWSSGVTWRAGSCTSSKQEGGSIAAPWKIKESLKVRSIARRAVSSRTAPGCLLTEGKQTAEVELGVTREEEHILRLFLSCVMACIIYIKKGTER